MYYIVSVVVKGRCLVDEVLMLNDVVDLAKRSKKLCSIVFQMDFKNAYDSVS